MLRLARQREYRVGDRVTVGDAGLGLPGARARSAEGAVGADRDLAGWLELPDGGDAGGHLKGVARVEACRGAADHDFAPVAARSVILIATSVVKRVTGADAALVPAPLRATSQSMVMVPICGPAVTE